MAEPENPHMTPEDVADITAAIERSGGKVVRVERPGGTNDDE